MGKVNASSVTLFVDREYEESVSVKWRIRRITDRHIC